MSTTVVNAFTGPRMGRYLDEFRRRVASLGIPAEPYTIHSNGGLMSVETARDCPVRTCVSGPAAGVVGAAAIGVLAGLPDLITFDVGGTSTDVSLIDAGTAALHRQPACRGLSRQDPDDRHPRHRRGRRLDRRGGFGRRAQGRSPLGRRIAGPRRLRPWRTRGDDHRRQSLPGPPRSGRLPRRAHACRSGRRPPGDHRNGRAAARPFAWRPPRTASSRSPTPI